MRESERELTVTEEQTAGTECRVCGQTVRQDELVPVTMDDGETQLCTFCVSSLFDGEAAASDRIEIPVAGADVAAVDTGGGTTAADRDGGKTAADTGDGETATDGRAGRRTANPTRASAVSWSPPDVHTGGGFFAGLVQLHALSLSLLWAIHRTNVRIAERILDEIDVTQVATLATTLTAVVVVVGLLV